MIHDLHSAQTGLVGHRGARRPSLFDGQRTTGEQFLVKAFVVVPLLALLAAVPLAWGWGLSWTDIGLAVSFYFLSGLGITVGFHRHFTHRAFKATRALKIGLAITGSMAFQGPIIHWVADHRRHHAFTDKEGDPHRRGCSAPALSRWPRASCTPT